MKLRYTPEIDLGGAGREIKYYPREEPWSGERESQGGKP